MIFTRLTRKESQAVRASYRALLDESIRRRRQAAHLKLIHQQILDLGWSDEQAREMAQIHLEVQNAAKP